MTDSLRVLSKPCHLSPDLGLFVCLSLCLHLSFCVSVSLFLPPTRPLFFPLSIPSISLALPSFSSLFLLPFMTPLVLYCLPPSHPPVLFVSSLPPLFSSPFLPFISLSPLPSCLLSCPLSLLPLFPPSPHSLSFVSLPPLLPSPSSPSLLPP